MNVGQLKKLLEGVDDSLKVLVPITQEFDGRFYSPCSEDSGKTTMGTGEYLTEEEEKEMKLLNKPIPEEDAFLLIPCGFDEEKDQAHELN